jgi:hypothetical protein
VSREDLHTVNVSGPTLGSIQLVVESRSKRITIEASTWLLADLAREIRAVVQRQKAEVESIARIVDGG